MKMNLKNTEKTGRNMKKESAPTSCFSGYYMHSNHSVETQTKPCDVVSVVNNTSQRLFRKNGTFPQNCEYDNRLHPDCKHKFLAVLCSGLHKLKISRLLSYGLLFYVIFLLTISSHLVRCETNIDDCLNTTCYNNGFCIDKINGFECNCTANYTGSTCLVSIFDRCANYPCKNNATCRDLNVTLPGELPFNCSCAPGYEGNTCEDMINYCEGLPCLNNATCESNYSIPFYHYKCMCIPGFTDYDCSTNIDDCSPDPCIHGTCRDLINGYHCECSPGWTGPNCSQDINECNEIAPCQNTGVCTNTDGSYTCNCSGTGYNGTNCTDDINECNLNFCKNSANCTNLDGDYFCNCTLGYEGKDCNVANCSQDNCLNSGTCNITSNHWKCNCLPHYEGNRCETKGPCVDMPCGNSATCSQAGDIYSCDCTKGWTGQNCTEDVKECSFPDPICRNGATCTELDGDYNCTCALGYTDKNCSTDIDECQSDPCQHNGKCSNLIDRYECNCNGTGYNGTNCEADIDECLNSPCNSGNCTNLGGNFNCTCPDEFLGKTCYANSAAICQSGYCKNGGSCNFTLNDLLETYSETCACPKGFSGNFCEKTGTPTTSEPDYTLAIILGPSVGGLIIVLIIGLLIFLMTAKSKRATRGTYSPSHQEMSGSRVEMGHVLKPPPEERLI